MVPVFSVDPEKGYGYSEETKPMLNTSHGFVPWDDLHHTELSQTNGEINGKWIFANANNTPRLARIDLKTFRTSEIIELPNREGDVVPIRALLDTGTTSTIVLKEFVKKGRASTYKGKRVNWNTLGGQFQTRRKALIDF